MQNKVYLGLVQPPHLFLLPASYAMLWLFGNTLLYIWVQHWILLFVAAISYIALWKASEWDPRFLDVVGVVAKTTPPTRNRRRRVTEGDVYASR